MSSPLRRGDSFQLLRACSSTPSSWLLAMATALGGVLGHVSCFAGTAIKKEGDKSLTLRQMRRVPCGAEGRFASGPHLRIPMTAACLGLLSSTVSLRHKSRRRKQHTSLRGWRRDMSLDGYPVHGAGYYWTLSKDTEAVMIYVPIADDVKSSDVVFSCREWNLQIGTVREKGGLVINDRVLYEVDVDDSYFLLDEGEYGERCICVRLEKRDKEQDWYAYDRFEPKSERFLLEGEKSKAQLRFQITHKCFFDIEIEGKPMGRIVFGLYGDQAPRTVENFRCLCTGEKGKSKETGEPLHYEGTRFHRILPGFIIQGGQTFENEEGSGGESIYGATFEDENLRVRFASSGLLAMANGGPNTNGSQFFITLNRADHLNFKCVGFGEVIDGMQTIRAIESLGRPDGEPRENAVVAKCGELEFEEGEQAALAQRTKQGGIDLTLRNQLIDKVRAVAPP
eukprot:TRINITY_DN8043_c1_g1_i2.p1 TRINITY_DN8043_c1_g1~~TRINITY_DN8043_c1_g1_i2.p1  ORF type:complete len:452 (-),score=67.52 TRINITY_DN8043_c1_g1_i2:68-1423(-)